MRPNGLNDNPTYKIDIDREKASAFGINLSDVDQTFSIAWGSRYVNNFLDTDGRIKRVYVQADAPFRMNPEDLTVALRAQHQREHGAVHVVRDRLVDLRLAEARALQRRFRRSEIQGQAAPGQSTGQAMAAMQSLMQQAAGGHRLRMDRRLAAATAVGLAGAACSTRFRFSSCS